MRLKDYLASGFSKAALQRASRLIDQRKPGAAIELLARAAKAGNAAAAYRLGRCYLEGGGFPVCEAEAVNWLEIAGAHGVVEAQTLLAAIYLRGRPGSTPASTTLCSLFSGDLKHEPDYEVVLAWAVRAAEAGCAEALALRAHILTFGPASMVDVDTADELYARSAAAGCARGMLGHALSRARRAASDQDWNAIILLFERVDDLPIAAYFLGLIHQEGRGTPPDLARAVSYFRSAAEKGHRAAQTSLGALLIEGVHVTRDLIQGESWLRRAASAGDVKASRLIAKLYIDADLLPPNYIEGANWLRRAAQGGDAAAARQLTQLYMDHPELACDPQEAMHWLEVSAKSGDQIARVQIGNLLLAGVPAPAAAESIRLQWEDEARKGDAAAAFNLGVCISQRLGTHQDEASAAEWFRKSAERLPQAQYVYGRMLAEGKGVDADPATARLWLRLASKAGLADAQVALAELLINGRGGPASPQEARKLFEQAAAQNHAGAMFALGVLCSGAYGMPTDPMGARHWLHAAAERGHGRANVYLAQQLGSAQQS